jgi:ribosomal protein S18
MIEFSKEKNPKDRLLSENIIEKNTNKEEKMEKKKVCNFCGEESDSLETMFFYEKDPEKLCKFCYEREEAKAHLMYEIQKEDENE